MLVPPGIYGRHAFNEISAPAKQSSPHHWQSSKAHFNSQFCIWRSKFRTYITKLCRQQAEVMQSHDNENVRNIGQGEARHGKYKRLKLGGGLAYDRSND
jgi:hypothetical protein